MPNNDLSKASQQIIVGQHYPELDGVRGIAILLVLFFHCRNIVMPQSPFERSYYNALTSGWVGVDLFFVLSGFLITGILLDTVNQKRYFQNFYWRRILRIFPLYYAILMVFTVLAVFGLLESFHQKSIIAQFSYWLYLQNWLSLFGLPSTNIIGHFWSLAIEEQFYLIWPALVMFAARRNWVGKLCIATVILALIARIIFVSYQENAYYFTFSRTDTLALGAYVAVLLRQHGSLRSFRRIAFFLAAISISIIVFIANLQGRFYAPDTKTLLYGLLPLAILFASFFIITLTAKEHGILRLILRSNWLRTIGSISYGVYIFHWPIIFLLEKSWPRVDNFWVNQLGFLAAISTFSITVAWFSYQYFEKPFLRLKDKIAPVHNGETV